jgi:hypothetical protein
LNMVEQSVYHEFMMAWTLATKMTLGLA